MTEPRQPLTQEPATTTLTFPDGKVCRRCAATLPITAFAPERRNRDGLESWCRGCRAAKAREHRATHPEKTRESVARWAAANQEKIRDRKRAYYAIHPEKPREQDNRRRTWKRGRFVERIDMAVLVERDGGRCGICQKRVSVAERSVDHILPLSKGGEHSYANVRLTHLRCNHRRNNWGSAQLRLVG